MLDVKWIKDNPNLFNESMIKRNSKIRSKEILFLHEKKIGLKKQIDEMKHKLKKFTESTIEAQKHKAQLQEKISNYKNYEEKLHDILNNTPNILSQEIQNEDIEIKKTEIIKTKSVLPHYETDLGIEIEKGVKISGQRFVFLSKKAAMLENALGQYMLQKHIKNGYQHISVPYIVNERSLYNTCQLPKFKEDVFCVQDNKWLIPTGEVPLVNYMQDQTIEKTPVKLVTLSPCFRAEAGARGKDTKGIIRQHQFQKVEMVQITKSNEAEKALSEMLTEVENILLELELPYRILMLGGQEIGFSAMKQYDIEVWMPGMEKYIEISSCSLCGDFQARRANQRTKNKKLLQTLNCSGLAIGRTIAAIIENHQISKNEFKIPEVLKPYCLK